jgi:hypothetical protein
MGTGASLVKLADLDPAGGEVRHPSGELEIIVERWLGPWSTLFMTISCSPKGRRR